MIYKLSRKSLLLFTALVVSSVFLTTLAAAHHSEVKIADKQKSASGKSDSKQAEKQAHDQAASDEKSDAKREIKIEADADVATTDAATTETPAAKSSIDAESLKESLRLSPQPDAVDDASINAQPAAPPLNAPLPQMSGESRRPGAIDFYLMLEYRREEMKYTGKPTTTNVFPVPVPPFSVPDPPIHFLPSAFEPNHEQAVGYASLRVKDYGFERLRFNTQVSFKYIGDLDGTSEASPFQTVLDNFRGRRILMPLSFYTDMTGWFSDDRLTNFNLRIGRQFINGAESILLDGGTFSINHPRFDLDVFGGRRVTFYADPEDRGVIGQNLLIRATASTTLKYNFLHYADNSHYFEVRHAMGESLILGGNFFLLNDHPVDLSVTAHYLPPDNKTRMVFSLLQRLTSDGFIYDYAYRTFARNPENQVFRRFFPLPPTGTPSHGNERLSLFDINPYTQAYVDVYRNFTQKFGAGGTFWIRHVNDSDNKGPFDNSFEELRASADYFPSAAFEIGTEYRFRNIRREDPEQAKRFDDIRREGETKFHEIYATSAYHFANNRLTLEGGLFYRRFTTQSRLLSLDGLDTLGVTAAAKLRFARNYKLLLEYGIDDELPFLYPDIDYTQSFRVRFEWHFSR